MDVASVWTTPSPTDLMPRRRVNTWDTVGPLGAIRTTVAVAAVSIEIRRIVTHTGTVTPTPLAAEVTVTKIGTPTAAIAEIGVNVVARPPLVADVTLRSIEGAEVTPEALPEAAALLVVAPGTMMLRRLLQLLQLRLRLRLLAGKSLLSGAGRLRDRKTDQGRRSRSKRTSDEEFRMFVAVFPRSCFKFPFSIVVKKKPRLDPIR